MSVCVLYDQTSDKLGIIHGEAEPDRRPEVVQVHEALTDMQPIEQFGHRPCVVIERCDAEHVRFT